MYYFMNGMATAYVGKKFGDWVRRKENFIVCVEDETVRKVKGIFVGHLFEEGGF